MNSTPFLPGFNRPGGRQRKSAESVFAEQLAECRKFQISQFRNLFSGMIPTDLLSLQIDKVASRKRIYTQEVSFWAFLTQILWLNSSCSEAVKAVQTWLKETDITMKISSNTAAYTKARAKLSDLKLLAISCFITKKATDIPQDKLWNGRRVKKVDGTSFQLNDTSENQALFPQSTGQKEGCGFPRCQVQGIICLATGILVDWVETSIKVHDSVAWKLLWQFFSAGDVIVADRAYGSYINFALLHLKEVDMVSRLNQKRIFTRKNAIIRYGRNDIVVMWSKPKCKPKHLSDNEWQSIDKTMKVRLIKYMVKEKGFRTKEVIVSTTLLDAKKYSASSLIDLYGERWGIEVRFRDIKTTMEMGELKSRTPEMVRKEILMTAIAYNLVRSLINNALKDKPDIDYQRISFAGALAQVRQWLPQYKGQQNPGELREIMTAFYYSLIDAPVPERPGRSEPRAKKKRSNKYKILNKKRNEMNVEKHRSKHKKLA